MTNPNEEYTWLDFFATVISILICFSIITGNFWCSEKSILRELQADYPVTKILKIERGIKSYTEILVEENEERTTYRLDTNCLWNYKFKKIDKTKPESKFPPGGIR